MSAVPLMSLHTHGADDVQDSEITDEDEDPLESVLNRMKYRAQLNKAKDFWSGLIFAGVICFVAGFVISYVTFLMLDKNKHSWAASIDADPQTASALLNEVSASKITEFLRDLDSPHSDNISDNLHQAQQIRQHFQANEVDSVSAILPSQILLSYFKDDLNQIEVLGREDGEEVVVYKGMPLSFDIPPNVNKFEVTNIIKGNVVYADFGRESDFHYLETKNITINNTIVLARVGKVLPIDLVDVALKRGALGVVLIAEKGQHSSTGNADNPYKSLLLPSQLGMLQVMHGNPALDSKHGVGSSFRCVPVQIITATIAEEIFKHIFSDGFIPESWRGNLSTFYSTEAAFSAQYLQLRLHVHIVNTEKTFYNVIAAIRGSHEPDRYVLVANNRESLLEGETEPLSGTAAMMELVRVLAKLKKNKGWHPRRSLVFCSWGISQGDQHFTSTPLPEEWGHALESRTVGYISVEAAVRGGGSFSALATPLLTRVLFESAALVPNPRNEEIAKGRMTLYESWLNATRGVEDRPFVGIIRGTGDMRTIIHNHGIPSLDFQYTNTVADYSAKDYKDINLSLHQAITQLWGILVWKLSDNLVIPFDVMQYSTFLNHSVRTINTTYQQTIVKHTIPLNNLTNAVENFSKAASAFQKRIKAVDQSNMLEVRIINDQLLHLERAFLHHTAIDKTNTAFRHIVLAPGKYLDNDPSSGFGILQDLLSDLTSCPDYASLRDDIISHITILVHCIMSATYALQDTLQPLALAQL